MGSRSDLTWGTKRTYGERGNAGADGGNAGRTEGTRRGAGGGEQRAIAAIYFLAVEIILHIHVEDFITYQWIPRTHFLNFI